jgi:DNA repair protein SbcC/Rad50
LINSVQIKNFQIHEDSTINFGPHVNVIAGPSHNGKSAVFKAIRWALFNEPNGDSFIKHGSKGGANVTLSVDDHTITRERSNKDNQYILDGTILKAMGTGVPDTISSVVNMDGSLNVQSQFDPFFMLQETSGAVAKKLNQIVGIEVIDVSLKKINSLLMERKKKREYVKETLITKELSLKEFDDVEDKLSGIKQVESLFMERDNIEGGKQSLIDYLLKWTRYSDQISEISFYSEEILDNIEKMCHSLNTLREREEYLDNQNTKLNSLTKQLGDIKLYDEKGIKTIEEFIKEYLLMTEREFQLHTYLRDEQSIKTNLDELGILFGEDDFAEAEQSIVEWMERQERIDSLKHHKSTHMTLEQKVDRLKEEMNKRKEEEDALYEANGGKCPVCGNLKGECCKDEN